MQTQLMMIVRWGLRWLIRLIVGWSVFAAGLILLFRFIPVPFTAMMLERALLTQRGWQHQWVPYAQISPTLKLAVIAAEDQRFPEHHGFDLGQMSEAWHAWQEGHARRGASTLSQQTAKNLLLWSHSDWLRKGLEVPLTALLELSWSKQRILEVYLNSAEWGTGIYGAEAAAQHYFHSSARQLTQEQAIRLAAILPAPREWSPLVPTPYIQQRVRWISGQMTQLGGTAYLKQLTPFVTEQ